MKRRLRFFFSLRLARFVSRRNGVDFLRKRGRARAWRQYLSPKGQWRRTSASLLLRLWNLLNPMQKTFRGFLGLSFQKLRNGLRAPSKVGRVFQEHNRRLPR